MGETGEILVSLFVPILTGAIIGAVAIGLGAFLAQPFFGRRRPYLVESFALGTLAISLSTLLWGSLSWMDVSARWSLGFLLILLSVVGWIKHTPTTPLMVRSFSNRTILALSLILLIGVILRIFLMPLYPPMGWDECASHLPAAREIVQSGRITFNPEIKFNSFPQNAEMLYVWAIAHSPIQSAHYVNFLAFLFSLLALVRLGRSMFTPKIGWLAALIMGIVGIVQYQAVHSNVDIWVMFYFLAAIMVGCEAAKSSSLRKVLLVGIFIGAAAGVRYSGLIGVLTLIPAFIAIGSWTKTTNREIPRWSYWVAILLALLVASPWYIRNIVWFNNPYFPFLSVLFPGGGRFFAIYGQELIAGPGTLLHTYAPGYFGLQENLWTQFVSQWYLWAAIPAGVWFWKHSPFIRFTITWTVLTWLFRMQGTSGIEFYPYYIYLIPVNVLVLANLATQFYTLPPGTRFARFMRIMIWVLLVIWVGAIGVRDVNPVPPLRSVSQGMVLSEMHGSYTLMIESNNNIPEDRKAVGILCEDGRLYAEFTLIGGGDSGWANYFEIAKACMSPRDLADLLRNRYSASYLIVHEERLEQADLPALILIRNLINTPEFDDFFRLRGRVGEGAVYRISYPRTAPPASVSDPE